MNRPRPAALLVTLLAVVAVVLPLGAAPAAAAPTVSLTKTAGILDGEVVYAEGTGFAPREVLRVVQCIGPAPDWCPTYPPVNGNGAVVTVAADGTFRARLRLWRTIDVPGGDDEPCTAGDCSVLVLNSGGEQLGQVFFDVEETGAATRPPASLTGATLASRANRATVRIGGRGFDPDFLAVSLDIDGVTFPIGFLGGSRGAYVAVCLPEDGASAAVCRKFQGRTTTTPGGGPRVNALWSVPVDAAGAVPTKDLVVPRVLDMRSGRVDCAVLACTFALTQDDFPLSNPVGVAWAPEWAPYPSATAMVDDAYLRLVGRRPTAGERSSAVTGLTHRSTTARAFVTGLAERTDGLRYAELSRLYQAALRRQPDGAGLSYWSARLRASGGDMAAVATAFGSTPEFRSRYGPTVPDAAAVDNAYVAILGRAALDSERAYWVGQLRAGLRRSGMVHRFSRSPEYVAAEGGRSRAGSVAVGLLRRGPSAGEWSSMQVYAGANGPSRAARVEDIVLAYLGSRTLEERVG